MISGTLKIHSTSGPVDLLTITKILQKIHEIMGASWKIIQVRCALNPPPCLWFWWWQTSGGILKSSKMNQKTIAKNVMADKWANAKSNRKPIQKQPTIVVRGVNFRGLAPARLTLFSGPDCGYGSCEFKNKPKRNPKTIAKNVMADKWANAKSNQKSIKKLRKSIKSRVWDHPGGSREKLGEQLGTRPAQGSKTAPKSREILLRFWLQNGHLVQFFMVFFSSVF